MNEFHKNIIEKIKGNLYLMGEKYNSPDAVALIFRTGLVESRYMYNRQNGGPAIGLFQMEPATLLDCIDWIHASSRREHLEKALMDVHFNFENPEFSLFWNPDAQIQFARIKYWRNLYPIPPMNEFVKQGEYWIRWYNTGGRGTITRWTEVVRNAEGIEI